MKRTIEPCLPNWAFNADAHSPHGFAILLGAAGALRPSGSGAS
jgi:hypothetical protein